MVTSIGRLRSAFSYRYHRFPGYLHAKWEQASIRLKKAHWRLQDLWSKIRSRPEVLTGKTRDEIKSLLFRDVSVHEQSSAHNGSADPVESYQGFNIYALEGRFFALSQEEGDFDVKLMRSNQYRWYSVGHSIPDVKQDIDRFAAERGGPATGVKIAPKERALFIGNIAPERTHVFLDRLDQFEVTILVTKGSSAGWQNYSRIDYTDSAGKEASSIDLNNTSKDLLKILREQNFDVVIAPYEGRKYWESFNLEMFVPAFAKRLMVMFSNGRTRSYKGEDLNRITYNKAFLSDMFRFVPPVKGKRVLEVGCSDGLACDLLLSEDPDAIVGVDSMEAVGCNYRDAKITYFNMDASNLRFKDRIFDVCYSLATLEHVRDPFTVLQEMKRVTRRGGYCKAHAGPLYHAPFGHHMFGYFDDYPWIHLRLSKDEIIEYAKQNKIDEQIRKNRGLDARDYVNAALTPEHINGLRLDEYRLREFMSQADVKVLSFAKNYEGENLLDDSLLQELSHVGKENLITSGFELIFKVK